MSSWDLRKAALVIAYFCDKVSKRERLEAVRKKIGKDPFQEALNLLEKFSIIEYPIEYPDISEIFPRGTPYPGINYIVVRFLFFPSWIQAYMYRLHELKVLLNQLRIFTEIVDRAREEVSTLDRDYKKQLRAQMKAIDTWQTQDKEVIIHLLDPNFKGEIKFSDSTMFWKNANW